ncbi:hypothetical protein SBOR_2552 [Sclerotinia borealis F-4128]|uniref:Translation machinery associated TMA7 n=1 Tax=Sclerotinia borealis (strain F-4128) TaxID=1432307 RepID=W9CMJ1_SCLBF|nr:hypothetical protein SBOR_2552 [Sclerotinia borealis F-4128]
MGGNGTTPLHNKVKKKVKVEDDEETAAFKLKQKEDKARQDKLAKEIGGQKGPLKTTSHGISGSGGKNKK